MLAAEFRPELHTLAKVDHPNLVKVIKMFDTETEGQIHRGVTLVLELCHGNLHDLLHGSLSRRRLCVDDVLQRLQAAADIACGVVHLHGLGI